MDLNQILVQGGSMWTMVLWRQNHLLYASKRNRKKTLLEKTNEVCLLFPNSKPASNQTKIQK
jgi:hypothetical protein